jgi:hypothetical protein
LKDDLRWEHIDDVIVRLHVDGENVWQAYARALRVDGASSDPVELFRELCSTGDLLLATGETRPLPLLDANGVAEVCTFELEAADYEADRVLTEEPSIPEPRVPAAKLWPALQRNAYKTGRKRAPWGMDYTPLARLAESTGIPQPTLQRLTTNATATVGVQHAVNLLMELDDENARELEEAVLGPWLDARDEIDRQGLGFEYFDGLARFAQHARCVMALTPQERQALDDIVWISVAAQRKSFLGTTASERLAETHEAFRTHHQREPARLSRRLRAQARRFFDHQADIAAERSRRLRRGLHHAGTSITAGTVTMRTHRLRESGRLPRKSRPKTFGRHGQG